MDRDVYASYTHALRHPVIVSHVAGWQLPWALSATQLGVFAATTIAMLVTRRVWAHLGPVGNLALLVAVVMGGTWAVRHWRIEGRSPLRALSGFVVVAVSPQCRLGVMNGEPVRPRRPAFGRTIPVHVSSSDGASGG